MESLFASPIRSGCQPVVDQWKVIVDRFRIGQHIDVTVILAMPVRLR